MLPLFTLPSELNITKNLDNSNTVIKGLFEALKDVDYAVLRNEDEIFTLLRGDIDLAIEESNLAGFLSCVDNYCKSIGINAWLLESHYHGLRIVIASKKKFFFLKLDLHFFESWRGISLLTSKEIISEASVGKTGIKVACEKHIVAIIIIGSVLVGGGVRSKYKLFVKAYLDHYGKDLLPILSRNFGSSLAERIIRIENIEQLEHFGSQVKIAIFKSVVKRNFGSFAKTYIGYVRTTLHNFKRPRGRQNQFNLMCHSSVSLKKISSLLSEVAPGFPIFVLDGTKIDRNFLNNRKYRSYEAIVYFQSKKSFQEDYALWRRQPIKGNQFENILEDFAYGTVKDAVSGIIFSILSKLKPLNHIIKHKDIV